MARMQGITGKLSGKMGAAVFRVREGQQIVTQYNPIVKNPNTSGQQTQRAKFKLMSQLAAIMAPGFGTMGTINRPARGKSTQRNAFTQLNMKLVEVVTATDEVTAKIPMEKLQLTSSFRALPPFPNSSIVSENIDITINEIDSAVKSVRFVLVGYKDEVATIIEIRDVPTITAEDNTAATFTKTDISNGHYTLLAYGLIPSESAKTSINLDDIHTPEDDDFISAVELNAMVAAGSMAETKTIGTNITVQTT